MVGSSIASNAQRYPPPPLPSSTPSPINCSHSPSTKFRLCLRLLCSKSHTHTQRHPPSPRAITVVYRFADWLTGMNEWMNEPRQAEESSRVDSSRVELSSARPGLGMAMDDYLTNHRQLQSVPLFPCSLPCPSVSRSVCQSVESLYR